jgi:ABC-type polysaccharide/polyol phosphate transport system ATPase subunit
LRRSDMRNKISDILEFAELTRFQDVELKKLSSGMQVRLAFSIAVQTEADIFLVDEALAVGDAEFQEKCKTRFRELKKQGKTIVLVSHDMELITSFCEKALYLFRGQTKVFGLSEQAADSYLHDMQAER